jgi:hypothetical protein
MKNTTIRVSDALLDDIRILKKHKGLSTYEELLQVMVRAELKKDHAYTADGYLSAGMVVEYEGSSLVIKSIVDNKVVFEEGSYAFNGSKAVYDLKFLADSVETYTGGLADV